LTWFDRSGRAGSSIVPSGGGEYLNPAIAPDGGLVAVNHMDPGSGNWDISIVAAGGDVIPLTSNAAIESDPIWSPDGRDVVFTSEMNGQLGLYRQSIDRPGGEPAELLLTVKGAVTLAAASWTPGGQAIVYSQSGPEPQAIWLLPLSGNRKPRRLLTGEHPRLSPDGHWLAYVSSETGSPEVYIQRFPDPGSKQRISEDGGVHPRWVDHGRELVYWSRPGGLKSVNIINGAAVGHTRAVVPSPVLGLADGRAHYDASADGKRFLVRQPAGPAGPAIKVIRNWK
jgi:Tol biopolymer transport system component